MCDIGTLKKSPPLSWKAYCYWLTS